MKKTSIPRKKLRLHRETLRQLDGADLRRPAGGTEDEVPTYQPTCFRPCIRSEELC